MALDGSGVLFENNSRLQNEAIMSLSKPCPEHANVGSESGDDSRRAVQKQAEAQKQDRNDRQKDDPLFVVLSRNSFHHDTFPFGCDLS